MTHIKYNPGAVGTGIFVLDPLKARFQKGTKQKSHRSGAPGIVFAGGSRIWIMQIIQKSGAPGIVFAGVDRIWIMQIILLLFLSENVSIPP